MASQKIYAEPFNEVDVDVIFIRGGEGWRVPAFWRGGSKRSVRFAPPAASDYIYHLEYSDHSNPDPNGRENRVNLTAELIQAIQVPACGEPESKTTSWAQCPVRYFQHATKRSTESL